MYAKRGGRITSHSAKPKKTRAALGGRSANAAKTSPGERSTRATKSGDRGTCTGGFVKGSIGRMPCSLTGARARHFCGKYVPTSRRHSGGATNPVPGPSHRAYVGDVAYARASRASLVRETRLEVSCRRAILGTCPFVRGHVSAGAARRDRCEFGRGVRR